MNKNRFLSILLSYSGQESTQIIKSYYYDNSESSG